MKFRSFLFAAAITILCSASLPADEMPFALTTSGTFNGLPARAELDFLPGSASGTTTGGESGPLTLGHFTLELPSSNPAIPYSGTFNLQVTFSVPAAILGGQSESFSSSIAGTVNRNNGWVSVDFGAARLFSFSNSQGSGAFSFAVQDIDRFDAGPNGQPASRALIGSISGASFTPAGSADAAAAVPEPSAVLLLISGVFGIFVSRKRFSHR